ncbi:DUF3828 domain-containing protein [Novosphingobium umbonatum]|uniref:DUF3828 domain-containing protein n=1 Tax=Novosphingobium umbonatum TaxID=1908524 RepID=A0A3S2UUG5_9SPHN|nr:DUF3828 domain-containing protein [Novosphingobium umbonatum]RVU05300.1 DUF3828 domain-containing protein [Novosphingobium umbonatum]
MRWFIAIALVAMPVALPVAVQAREPTGARAFMERVIRYALRDDSDPDARSYRSFFAERLDRAMMLDRHAPEQEIGFLEAEVICGCQDNEGLVMSVVSVNGDADHAKVKVLRRWNSKGRGFATFSLAREHGFWKIADIAEMHTPSLQAGLDQANAKLLKEREKVKGRY